MMKKYTLDNAIFFALALFSFFVVYSVTAVEAALLIALILLLVKTYRENTMRSSLSSVKAHPLFVPWCFYLGVCLLTIITAQFPGKALGQFNSDFLKFLCFSTLFLTVKKENLPALSGFYLAAAALSAVIGIGQVSHLVPSVYGDSQIRANAMMNAVRYAEVMVIALTLALANIFIPREGCTRLERIAYIALAVVALLAVILSRTRGAYLGMAVCLACFIAFGKGFRLKALGLAALLFAAGLSAALVNPEIGKRLTAVTNKSEPGAIEQVGINTRMELWKMGYRMLKDHPVLGVGPDNVKPLFTVYHPELIEEKKWGSLHNLYIHQAAERGLAGLGALLFLFWGMFSFALHRYKEVRSPYTLWALCVLPTYYVMNLTEISFQHVHTSFAIFLALAFSAAAGKENVQLG